MSGIKIDVSGLREIQSAFGATESQFKAAFNKAIKQTANKLYRESVAMVISASGAKGKSSVGRRVKAFVERATNSNTTGNGKIWFGLNDFPVSKLKGSLKNPKKIIRKRDNKGRFIKQKGSRGATFIPKSTELGAMSFPNSFVATIRGKKSIWVRSGNFISEAEIPVYGPIAKDVATKIAPHAGAILIEYFEKDLKGRVAGGIK